MTIALLGAGFDDDGHEIRSDNVRIVDDPVYGPQLHNVNELRAATVDKALMYIDTALARRTQCLLHFHFCNYYFMIFCRHK
jgi:hypothetical protein